MPPRGSGADARCECEPDDYGHMLHCPVPSRTKLDALYSEIARRQRLFNRLEAAISHHKKAHDSGRYFADDPDEALWKARDKILRDASDPLR